MKEVEILPSNTCIGLNKLVITEQKNYNPISLGIKGVTSDVVT